MQNIWKNCWVHLNSKQQQQQINTVNWSKLKHRKAAKSPLTHKTSVITASLIKTCFCLQLSEVKAKAILLNLHSVSCFLGRKCEEGGERKKERKEGGGQEGDQKEKKEDGGEPNQAGSNRQRAGRQEVNTQSTTSPTVTTTFKLNIKICTHNPVQVHNVSSTCIHKHRALMVFYDLDGFSATSLRAIRVRGRLPKTSTWKRKSCEGVSQSQGQRDQWADRSWNIHFCSKALRDKTNQSRTHWFSEVRTQQQAEKTPHEVVKANVLAHSANRSTQFLPTWWFSVWFFNSGSFLGTNLERLMVPASQLWRFLLPFFVPWDLKLKIFRFRMKWAVWWTCFAVFWLNNHLLQQYLL